jgi:hypothetical protein
MTAPFDAQTDHQIIALGDNRMELRDNTTGDTIASAVRDAEGQNWRVDINMDNAQDFETLDRAQAINHMIFDRPDVDPSQPGYSTMVPHGLPELP